MAGLGEGDKDRWNSHGDPAHGKTIGKQASPGATRSDKIFILKENPGYIVETDYGSRSARKARGFIPDQERLAKSAASLNSIASLERGPQKED
ncbi:MAG TPA: hypothetical protein VNT42_14745 [Sphingomonas sp.]|nr:hypothetical protein [Sphingomonas sp.]